MVLLYDMCLCAKLWWRIRYKTHWTVDADTYYTRFSAVKTKSILTPSFPSTTRSSPFFCPHFSLLYSKYPCKTWSPISLSFTLLPFSTWHILLLCFVFLCFPPLSLSFFLFIFSLLQVLPVSGPCVISQLWPVATLSLTVVWLATPITPSSGLKTGQRHCQTTIVRWCMRTALWSWAMCRRVRTRGRICAACSSNPSSPLARLSMSQSKVSYYW